MYKLLSLLVANEQEYSWRDLRIILIFQSVTLQKYAIIVPLQKIAASNRPTFF